jgi:DNA gyrase subunit B
MTVKQIAELIARGERTVRAAMTSGKLPYTVPAGNKRRDRTASREDVLRWAAKLHLINRKFVEVSDDLVGLPVSSVEEVEPSCEMVYDFSVADDENFICGVGGICCHNTADADTDGAHISYLLIAIIHELFPEFLREGRLFIARPPLFSVKLDGRGEKVVYAYSDEEKDQIVAKYKRSGGDVQRFKGLGEMDPEELAEAVLDPDTRILWQVSVEDAAEVAEALNLVMGSKAEPRKEWLESGGAKAAREAFTSA